MIKANKRALERLGVAPYDTADYLRTEDDALHYLKACIEEAGNDAAFIAQALGTIAKAQALMAAVAGTSGLSRESLYKALSGHRDPAFSTILRVAGALGYRLSFEHLPNATAPVARISAITTGNTGALLTEFSTRDFGNVRQVGSHGVGTSTSSKLRTINLQRGRRPLAGTTVAALLLVPDAFRRRSRPRAGASFRRIEGGSSAVTTD